MSILSYLAKNFFKKSQITMIEAMRSFSESCSGLKFGAIICHGKGDPSTLVIRHEIR